MLHHDLKSFLDEKAEAFNRPFFIEKDPISIPHRFSQKEDREISGFLTALLAWGQRPVILRNSLEMMRRMDQAPFDFILHHRSSERRQFADFVHRTFNGEDAIYLLKSLQQVYREKGGLENIFSLHMKEHKDLGQAISAARSTLLSFQAPARTSKHIADPLRNSSAKRICMFLRWMVRKDRNGVDFGIWKGIQPKDLYCPLDLHSGRMARSLGLLQRKQDDWKAVTELTLALRRLDAMDPVKYDFALYGLGVFEGFR
ncbi:MAG: TIGR02757 family protein [Bacteroidia bacterium]|nr:TIGR02757 family protein [Bacteroidia bacterium]